MCLVKGVLISENQIICAYIMTRPDTKCGSRYIYFRYTARKVKKRKTGGKFRGKLTKIVVNYEKLYSCPITDQIKSRQSNKVKINLTLPKISLRHDEVVKSGCDKQVSNEVDDMLTDEGAVVNSKRDEASGETALANSWCTTSNESVSMMDVDECLLLDNTLNLHHDNNIEKEENIDEFLSCGNVFSSSCNPLHEFNSLNSTLCDSETLDFGTSCDGRLSSNEVDDYSIRGPVNTEQFVMSEEAVVDEDSVGAPNADADAHTTPCKNIEQEPVVTPQSTVSTSMLSDQTLRQSVSAAVHEWVKKTYGTMHMFQRVKLEIRHMVEVLSCVGAGTKYNLLENQSPEDILAIWTGLPGTVSEGRGGTGFINVEGLHLPDKSSCPYDHCMFDPSSPISPLTADLMILTPSKNRNVLNSKMASSRNLFPNEANGVSKKSQTYGMNEEVFLKLTKRIEDLENQVSNNNKENSEPSETTVGLKARVFEFKCSDQECDEKFTSVVGMLKHQKNFHPRKLFEDRRFECPHCHKSVKWIDKHIREAHYDICGEVCIICNKWFKAKDIVDHKGSCKSCPKCGTFYKRKDRLKDHIAKNECSPEGNASNTDHPSKLPISIEQQFETNWDVCSNDEREETVNCNAVLDLEPLESGDHNIIGSGTKRLLGNNRTKNVSIELDSLNCGRKCFPFDRIKNKKKDNDEGYVSEHEEDDTPEATLMRRFIKDDLEQQARVIDNMQNEHEEGDKYVLDLFMQHLNKHNQAAETEGDDRQEPATNKMYWNAIKRHLFPAYHEHVKPSKAEWFLDCENPKPISILGVERSPSMLTEPMYVSVAVVEKILDKFDKGETGTQRCTFLAALPQWMNFIELHFNRLIAVHGREVLDRVLCYHSYVYSYLRSTKEWRKGKQERKKQCKDNKIIKEFTVPNKDAKVLTNYRKYLSSDLRLNEIKKTIRLASSEVKMVSDSEFANVTRFVHSEGLRSTGARPNVLNRLTNGGYSSMDAGFSPWGVSKEDGVPYESKGESVIYTRINPNIPPKSKACIHQLESNSAVCSENCPDKALPEGFNIFVDWDKTRESKGSYYLHLAFEIKVLFDLYDIIKKKYFGGASSISGLGDNWLYDEKTPFFLTCKGTALSSANVKHLSDALGIDVCAYDFRRIACTWNLCHESPEIRALEGDVMQHGERVANDRYRVNKQLKPQKVIQQYIAEEGILTDKIQEELRKVELNIRDEVLCKQQERKNLKMKNLVKKKNDLKTMQEMNRPLGPRHKVMKSLKDRFSALFTEITGESLKQLVSELKPKKWRNHVVKTVCSHLDVRGEEMRRIWLNIYKGDLCYGVRDQRMRAKEKGWPVSSNRCQKDRFSWIAFALHDSFKADIRGEKVTMKNSTSVEGLSS